MPCHTRMKIILFKGILWLYLWGFSFLAASLEPGFLDFDNLPDTNFSCVGKVIGGYYADLETSCQMFHVCTIGQLDEPMDIRFLCLNGTVFDQETRVCERIDEVDCSKSEQFYSLNLELYGNTQPPILEDTPDTDPPDILKHPASTTTTTTTTQRPTKPKTTRPSFIITTTPKPPPSSTTLEEKFLQSHHFPGSNSADIRFNPEEINISLNPGAPPNIRQKPVSFQQSISDNNKRVIVTTHTTVYKNDNSNNKPVISTMSPQVVETQKPKHIVNYNDGGYFNSEKNLDYETEIPHHEISFRPSFRPSSRDIEQHYTPKSSTFRSQYHPTTISPVRIGYSHRGPTTYRNAYSSPLKPALPYYHRTDKPPRIQLPLPLIPTLSPLTFSSPAPFSLNRHVEAKRFADHHQPPRIVISASASVSDASGRKFNYSLGTIGDSRFFGQAPHSYDDYKEDDVGLDPFYHDVPKLKRSHYMRQKRDVTTQVKPTDRNINRRKSLRSKTLQKELEENSGEKEIGKRSANKRTKRKPEEEEIRNEKEAIEVLKFLFNWYNSHEKVSEPSIPIKAETITEINKELNSNYDYYEDYELTTKLDLQRSTPKISENYNYESDGKIKETNGRNSEINEASNTRFDTNFNYETNYEIQRSTPKTNFGRNPKTLQEERLQIIKPPHPEPQFNTSEGVLSVTEDAPKNSEEVMQPVGKASHVEYEYVDDNYEAETYTVKEKPAEVKQDKDFGYTITENPIEGNVGVGSLKNGYSELEKDYSERSKESEATKSIQYAGNLEGVAREKVANNVGGITNEEIEDVRRITVVGSKGNEEAKEDFEDLRRGKVTEYVGLVRNEEIGDARRHIGTKDVGRVRNKVAQEEIEVLRRKMATKNDGRVRNEDVQEEIEDPRRKMVTKDDGRVRNEDVQEEIEDPRRKMVTKVDGHVINEDVQEEKEESRRKMVERVKNEDTHEGFVDLRRKKVTADVGHVENEDLQQGINDLRRKDVVNVRSDEVEEEIQVPRWETATKEAEIVNNEDIKEKLQGRRRPQVRTNLGIEINEEVIEDQRREQTRKEEGFTEDIKGSEQTRKEKGVNKEIEGLGNVAATQDVGDRRNLEVNEDQRRDQARKNVENARNKEFNKDIGDSSRLKGTNDIGHGRTEELKEEIEGLRRETGTKYVGHIRNEDIEDSKGEIATRNEEVKEESEGLRREDVGHVRSEEVNKDIDGFRGDKLTKHAGSGRNVEGKEDIKGLRKEDVGHVRNEEVNKNVDGLQGRKVLNHSGNGRNEDGKEEIKGLRREDVGQVRNEEINEDFDGLRARKVTNHSGNGSKEEIEGLRRKDVGHVRNEEVNKDIDGLRRVEVTNYSEHGSNEEMKEEIEDLRREDVEHVRNEEANKDIDGLRGGKVRNHSGNGRNDEFKEESEGLRREHVGHVRNEDIDGSRRETVSKHTDNVRYKDIDGSRRETVSKHADNVRNEDVKGLNWETATKYVANEGNKEEIVNTRNGRVRGRGKHVEKQDFGLKNSRTEEEEGSKDARYGNSDAALESNFRRKAPNTRNTNVDEHEKNLETTIAPEWSKNSDSTRKSRRRNYSRYNNPQQVQDNESRSRNANRRRNNSNQRQNGEAKSRRRNLNRTNVYTNKFEETTLTTSNYDDSVVVTNKYKESEVSASFINGNEQSALSTNNKESAYVLDPNNKESAYMLDPNNGEDFNRRTKEEQTSRTRDELSTNNKESAYVLDPYNYKDTEEPTSRTHDEYTELSTNNNRGEYTITENYPQTTEKVLQVETTEDPTKYGEVLKILGITTNKPIDIPFLTPEITTTSYDQTTETNSEYLWTITQKGITELDETESTTEALTPTTESKYSRRNYNQSKRGKIKKYMKSDEYKKFEQYGSTITTENYYSTTPLEFNDYGIYSKEYKEAENAKFTTVQLQEFIDKVESNTNSIADTRNLTDTTIEITTLDVPTTENQITTVETTTRGLETDGTTSTYDTMTTVYENSFRTSPNFGETTTDLDNTKNSFGYLSNSDESSTPSVYSTNPDEHGSGASTENSNRFRSNPEVATALYANSKRIRGGHRFSLATTEKPQRRKPSITEEIVDVIKHRMDSDAEQSTRSKKIEDFNINAYTANLAYRNRKSETTQLPNFTSASFSKSANPTIAKNPKDLFATTPLSKSRGKNFTFNCFGKVVNKFYSDPRDCRLFHYCTKGFTKTQLLDMKFVCDLGTYFDSEKLICTKDKPVRCT